MFNQMVDRFSSLVSRCCIAAWCLFIAATNPAIASDPFTDWRVGFAKVDITPDQPVRMSGYGSRDRPNEGIETKLFVRAIAMDYQESHRPHVLVSIDSIGLSGEMSRVLTDRLYAELKMNREQIVLSSTHTHCAPDLASSLTNLFAVPLSTIEQQHAMAYRQKLESACIEAVHAAISTMEPAQVSFGQGSVGFAANRRLLQEGRWVGFGVQGDGPVDHSVPVLCIRDKEHNVKGVVFNYACHCTTLGGDYDRIHADWAGVAAESIESHYPNSIALCTIGCGADANPSPRGAEELALQHGKALAVEVQRIIESPMASINRPLQAQFDYAGLEFELPSKTDLQQRLENESPQVKRNAQHLIETYESAGRLPATYPVPIQTWKFGDQLTMIFLGGEVVVDYTLRLKRELNDPNLWVTAYANDVLGYICSQRMRDEQGYEYLESGVYYNLPGPWTNGTEDLLISRIQETLEQQTKPSPLTPNEAIETIVVPDGFEVQLVASEPLVTDPINLAFGSDGKLWVVEMGDYPNGGEEGKSLGRVKLLTDEDQNGQYDHATVFADGISFPTGVHPWRNGVLISAAPSILYAEDLSGDGVADTIAPIYTGFDLANPQHRVNGFSYGLDHCLYLAAGDNLHEVRCEKNGEVVNLSGCDLKIQPDEGTLHVASGRSQYIRSRNDWGDWFGSDNSRPMFHYPVDEKYIRRVGNLRIENNMQQLFEPPVAPPVYPRSKTVERFNDLFASNRFTSACSAIVFRSSALGSDICGSAFVCEPVHNLVHNAKLNLVGSTYAAERFPDQSNSEFLTSTDPWFRPVRAVEGPDGMLWVVDMYRKVIEHPEWIPIAWQEQLDLRAGHDLGRIYRVLPTQATQVQRNASAHPNLSSQSLPELVEFLRSDSGALRDLAQQELLCREESHEAVDLLKQIATDAQPTARVHALWCLANLRAIDADFLVQSVRSMDSGVLRNALIIAEQIKVIPDAHRELMQMALQQNDPTVDLQLALSLGNYHSEDLAYQALCGESLVALLERETEDEWLDQAILSSAASHAQVLLTACLSDTHEKPLSSLRKLSLVDDLMELGSTDRNALSQTFLDLLQQVTPESARALWLTQTCLDANLLDVSNEVTNALKARMQEVYSVALSQLENPEADFEVRLQSIASLGRGLADPDQDQKVLLLQLRPQQPVELQMKAIEQLGEHFSADALDAVFANWSSLTEPIRQTIVDQCLRYNVRSAKLLDQIELGNVARQDLGPSAKQQLLQTGNQTIRVRASRLFAETESRDKQQLIQLYLDSASKPGDHAQGAQHFKRLCAACHTADESGRSVGPNLKNLTDRSSKALITSILDPNHAVDPQYRNYQIMTTDGQTLSGAIAQEIGNSLTLAQPNGKFLSINRSDIEMIKCTNLSLMPDGLHRELDFQAMSDLLEYLR